MLNFEYKGISLGKYVEGEIEALNSAEAAHKLKDQKVIITKLKETKKKKEKVHPVYMLGENCILDKKTLLNGY